MPEFNYLKSNSDFPNIGNVNVYKYDNDFNYDRYDYNQMTLQICTVPWDMGEAHIGNRTISGIGNVVYFGSKEERDKWFDKIPDSECYRFETKFKELHKDLAIDVPIPYDMCAKHNYLRVTYNLFANDDSPVMYEGTDGLREWYWFIREVEFVAPNTTRLVLLPDAFQTWIYDVTVQGMVLERGHAPMFAMRTDEYLQNPIENNTFLLTEDINFSDSYQTKHIDVCGFNSDNVYACIATTANPRADFGTKAGEDWHTPAAAAYEKSGVPSTYVFAIDPEQLYTFLENVNTNIPQFKQTIQAVFFVSSDLITPYTSFTFAGITCYDIESKRTTLDFVDLDKSQFGYDAKYVDMAKLHTYPYARIAITDENGNTDFIRIEDTTGVISVSAMVSLSYPFLTIDTHLMGVGGNEQVSITYKNIAENDFTVFGNWYDYIHTWNIQTFAVILDPSIEYDYSSYFDRKQARIDYYAAWDNAYDLADTLTANADLQAGANSSKVSVSNANMLAEVDLVNAYDGTKNQGLNQICTATAISTIQAADMQGSIAAASGLANGITSAIGAAATGNVAGAVSAGVGAIVGSAATLSSVAVTNGLTSAQAGYTIAGNNTAAAAAHSTNSTKASYTASTQSSVASIENGLTTGSAANSAGTQKGNADRTANAAADAITNGIKQAALRAPFMYGSAANGETAASKPLALFAQVQTQDKASISAAGDHFARYGYAYNKQWNFNGNWNIGKYFTYWKLTDFWVTNLNVPDMYMDRLRFFLFGGVTVWRKPEYIGKINIYDNF